MTASLIKLGNGKYVIRLGGFFNRSYLTAKRDGGIWQTLQYASRNTTIDTEEEALEVWNEYKAEQEPTIKVVRKLT